LSAVVARPVMFDPDAGMPRINRVMVYLGSGDVRPNEVALNSQLRSPRLLVTSKNIKTSVLNVDSGELPHRCRFGF
jgi:hypothetical protein